MYHTLKTLYENQSAKNPELLENFRHLEDYCLYADQPDKPPGIQWLNTGYRSIKWFIYSLRNEIEPGELQNLFHRLLAEAAAYRGEDWLYANILEFREAKPYKRLIKKPEFDIDDWPIEEINGWRVLINTTTQNITNFVFKDDWADIILVVSPQKHAAVILSYQRAGDVNLEGLYNTLLERGEAWHMVNDNLIICGGPKAPEKTTDITIDELLELLKHRL